MWKRASIAAVLALSACASTPFTQTAAPVKNLSIDDELALAAICGADAAVGKSFAENLTLAKGMGTGGFPVDTKVPAAQTWFDYGLSLSHAFYHEDAKVAMRKAVAADPDCSLCVFGEAFVLGPTLNYRINDTQRAAALEAAMRAQKLAKPGDTLAAQLAAISVARYEKSDTTTEPAFGQALAKIAAERPNNIELSVIAAHALLIPVRGPDKSGLKPALAILERVLSASPNDTGAIHYYIHATEFDGRAKDALPYAKRLGTLAPMASHLVHMPAHTFFRAGLYQEAAVVNAKAIGADTEWRQIGGDAPDSAVPMYYAHNLQFGMAGALMSGDKTLALKYAGHAPSVWPMKPGEAAGGVVARSWVALALYAPDQALAVPVQPKDSRTAMWRTYARGEAFLRKGDIKGAQAELAILAAADPAKAPAEQVVAQGVLAGRIALAKGQPAKAATLFTAAAVAQETKLSSTWDPPAWWYPVRRSAAAAHLAAGDYAKAATEAEKSLAYWEADPLALWVLAKAQEKQGRPAAAATMAQAARLWRGDITQVSPRTI